MLFNLNICRKENGLNYTSFSKAVKDAQLAAEALGKVGAALHAHMSSVAGVAHLVDSTPKEVNTYLKTKGIVDKEEVEAFRAKLRQAPDLRPQLCSIHFTYGGIHRAFNFYLASIYDINGLIRLIDNVGSVLKNDDFEIDEVRLSKDELRAMLSEEWASLDGLKARTHFSYTTKGTIAINEKGNYSVRTLTDKEA